MTGEQTTLVLGLVVFGVLVVLLSRGRARTPETAPRVKSKPVKSPKKRRR